MNVVMYHYIRDLKHSRYPRIKGLDVSDFRKQIEFFSCNYTVVTMENVFNAILGKDELPEKAILLTFDDGYSDNYTYALPILEEYGVQGSFFVPGKVLDTHELLDVNKIHYILAGADASKLFDSVKDRMDYFRGREYDIPPSEELWEKYAISNAWDDEKTIFVKRMLQTALPERLRRIIVNELYDEYVGVSETVLSCELYMSNDQVKAMKRHGMYIGVHGYDHYWLNTLSHEELIHDIDKALEIMDGFIDRSCWAMNYPYGGYSDDVTECARKKGACVGFTVDRRSADLKNDDPMLLPRFDCNDFPPKGTLGGVH